MTQYISLHNRTDYSVLNSLVSPKELFNKAKELGQSSLAITDLSSMAGMWACLKASKDTGVKLIAGTELYFTDDVSNKTGKLRHIVLLATNYIGYKNLLILTRLGFNASPEGKKPVSIIDWNLLRSHSDGIICLTGCGNGIISQHINNKAFDAAELALKQLIEIFGENLGIEIQAHNLVKGATYHAEAVNQVFTNNHLIRLAKQFNIKVIPTTNTLYLNREDHEIHDCLLAIGAMQPIYSNARIKYNVSDLYLKSGDEIKAFFTRTYGNDFAEEICANTVEFASKCEDPLWIDPKIATNTEYLLPTFDVRSEYDYTDFVKWLYDQDDKTKSLAEDAAFLKFRCERVLVEKKLNDNIVYVNRLIEELDVLEHQKFSSYMLIVQNYLDWARENGVATGPGRGSIAGSLIGYLLDIHKADPIKYGLIFARFQNKERKSPPDIDLDFSKKNRGKVIDYIISKYGKENVAQVSNIIGLTPKVFVRDVARACELGGSRKDAVSVGNTIADTVPKKVDEKDVKTFKEAVKYSPLFAEYVKKYPQLEKYGSICGKHRGYGMHAAAIVASKFPLAGLVPLRKDKDGTTIIEYDKDIVEANGLIKMDILGLSTLDVIDETNRIIKSFGKDVPSIDYDAYDKKTYDLISNGDTFGVFQFGTSAGTIDLCRKVKPKNIMDLAIITTLARPAARDIRAAFIEARNNKKAFTPIHPSLNNAFGKTFGFGLFDESILQLGQDVAGWSLHSADRIRKMIKDKGKNPEKDAKLREEFINDTINRGVEPKMAIRLWDEEISKFRGYTFNLSHAVLYSMLSFHTAFLKAHFPIEFLLANLMNELGSNTPDAEKNIDKIKSEIRTIGIKIFPPDINTSNRDYNISQEGILITGLSAIRNVGNDAIDDIISKRPFNNFNDFIQRVDTRKVRSNTIQALAVSGCFDKFKISRKQVYMYCNDYRKKLQVWSKKHDISKEQFEYPWPIEKEWAKSELYALEKEFIGEAFVCGKKHAFVNFFNSPSTPIKSIRSMSDRDNIPSVRAEIKDVFQFKVKKETSKYLGQDMIKATIEDEFGDQISLTVFPKNWKAVKDRMKTLTGNKFKFEPGISISFSGSVNLYDDEIGVVLNELFDFAPPPQMPKDLKEKKKVSIRKSKDDATKSIDISDTDKMVETIEDELFDEGLIDLNNEEDDNDDDFFP